MTVTLPGLATGLDTTSIISSLSSVQQAPITAMQSRKTNIDSAVTTITAFSSKLSALATAARALDTTAEWNSTSATSSDTASVVASTSSGAVAGGYDVRVTQLAREQRTQSNTVASATSALGLTGTLTMTIGSGSPVTVNLSAGDTLTDIASHISNSGARINASVIYDGARYRLMVRGLDTGAASSIAFNESDAGTRTTLGLSNVANTYQSAQDAQFSVDNIAMTRSTNQVTDAVPGVTLGLVKTTSSALRVTVANDPAALRTKVQSFITAYNDVVNVTHASTGYGTSKPANAVLTGDRALRGSLERLSSIVSSAVPGTTGRYTTLGSVGVALQNDGTLRLDDTKFSAAINADSAGVSKLFVTDAAIGATGAMSTIASAVDSLTGASTSLVRSRIDSLNAQSRRMSTDITKKQTQIAQYADNLRTQFAALEGTVSKYKSLLSAAQAISGLNTSG